ncbi:MAG: tryptophan synthase subunit alpha [Gemmatales bacterium]|nr:tryptophan synthase subunit alpha [Gemmatales bacterium]MDW8387675.1 tryptophan synthase subunit alpha [Gemmatales bacterium]
MTTNPIDRVFADLRQRGRKAFIPFLTAGDPDLKATGDLFTEVVRHGADLVEIGFPYSDPIADGPVIQASYTRALSRGLKVEQIFAATREWVHRGTHVPRSPDGEPTSGEHTPPASGERKLSGPTPTSSEEHTEKASEQQTLPASEEHTPPASGERKLSGPTPLLAMVSYSIILRRRPDRFLDEAHAAGYSGLIVPDLPAEESASLVEAARQRDLKLIQLVTPTTPRDRAAFIARQSSGFLYCVSVTGITGARDRLPPQLLDQLAWLRTQTDLPLCVGFGISRPEHVAMLRDHADGIIVGSALVKRVEEGTNRPWPEVVREVGQFVASLVQALNPQG